MLDKLSHEDFQDRTGETFTATADSGDVLRLTLTKVDVGGDAPEGHRTPFSLEFRDASPGHLPQQTHSVEHDALGQFPLFLVPLGPDAAGMRYEAVFG